MKVGASAIVADEDPSVERWLQAEMDRIWLAAELCLRHFQRAQLRPQPEHVSLLEIESIFGSRHLARGRGGGRPGIEDLEQALAAIEGDGHLAALRAAAPIGRLVGTLDLRPQELEVLLLSLAPHIDAPLAEVFQVLRGSTARRGVDLALVTQLYHLRRAQRMSLLSVMDPDRPLLCWNLIQVMPAEAPEAYGSVFYRAVQPTLDVLSALKGRPALSPLLARSARLLVPAPTLADLHLDAPVRQRLSGLCAAARAACARALPGEQLRLPTLVLWGGRGAGKREIAARVAASAGRPLLSFDPSAVELSALDGVLRQAQREALIHGAVLYVGPLSGALLAEEGRALTRRFEGYPSVAMFGVEALAPPRLQVSGPVQEVEVPLPSEEIRVQLWVQALPPERWDSGLDLPALARAFRLSPGEIRETAAEAADMAGLASGGAVTHAALRSGIERRLRNELGDLARRITVSATFSDLVLPPEDMFRVREFIGRALHATRVYTEWGFGPRLQYGKGMIALFSGPPGTGKTLLAGLIGGALDLDVYQVDLSQVVSKWVGETEKQLARVFDQAERAHAVLLFDEADALFAKRTEVKGANDRYGNLAVNYLLQRLEQYSGVAVLTTNKEPALDEALQRRLSLHLRLQVPEPPERERLWRTMLPGAAPVHDDIDFGALAREYELAGGYIKNVAVRAAFLAAADEVPIHMDLLRHAAALELEDRGRLITNQAWAGTADRQTESQR